MQQEKGKIEATKIVEESKKLKKRRDKVFVTVDEVGYEPDDNKVMEYIIARVQTCVKTNLNPCSRDDACRVRRGEPEQ